MSRTRRTAIPESDHLYEYGLDLPRQRVWLDGDIDRELIVRTIKGISLVARQSEGPIQLVINSDGGDMVQAFALIDYIRSIPQEVHGYVSGRCESAALAILQACAKRYATANSVLMTHRGSRETEFDLEVDRRADQFIATRMGWTVGKLDKFHTHDRFMFADRALELGLIDEIQEELR